MSLLVVALVDAPADRRLFAAGSVVEAAGAVLRGVPLIKSGSKAKSLASTRYGGNEELRLDFIRSAVMGAAGLLLLISGFAVQFVAQLFV